ncbi:MAG: CIA30 family protein [Jaaginema sp. PMC 1079.18]|nr:CIA30 family protein [Jaaginema sp. PMC 1080.18]MEC4852585.1 CIA30 family protein [Jaaginema sp. PMC 1079.18]MEC4867476.1 CIA30 family protein [Jaaginema sp. PMC 1078.18]
MSQRQTWNFSRFLQTIAYFEIFPIVGTVPWLRRLILGENAKMTRPAIATKPDRILLASSNTQYRQTWINQLRQSAYQVRVLASAREESLGGDGVEYSAFDLGNPQDLNLSLFQDIKAVIFDCDEETQNSLEKLVQLAKMSLKQTYTQQMLFDFREATEAMKQIWGAVDDVVMGGVSESGFRLGKDKAIFAGNVSTANSGGFASVRNRNFDPPLDLAAYNGIQLRVKGDGKRYKCILRCEGKWDGISYCYSFDTVANTWITVYVPFAELRPVFRAKTVTEADKLDASRVYSIQLMLSKFEYDGDLNPNFEPGYFTLEVESIQAYGGEVASQLIVVNRTSGEIDTALLQKSGLHYAILNCDTEAEATAISPEKVGKACLDLLQSPEDRDRVFNLSSRDRLSQTD